MSKMSKPTTSPTLISMETSSALIQIVATSRGVLLDLQATNVATDGSKRKSHAITKFTIDDALRFEAGIQRAIDAALEADGRQTALWPNVTFSELSGRVVA